MTDALGRRCLRLALVWVAGAGGPGWAHSQYEGAIRLDFRGTAAQGEVAAPLERLEKALGLRWQAPYESAGGGLAEYLAGRLSARQADGRAWRIEPMDAVRLSNVDGAAYVAAQFRLTPPDGGDEERFDLTCEVPFDRAPWAILVSTRRDGEAAQLAGVLRDGERTVRIERGTGGGFRGVFPLGLRSLREGSDELLFLLVMLLPAPLVAVHGRWWPYADTKRSAGQAGKVVGAFTAGHLAGLMAGAMGAVHGLGQPVEALIGVSMLVAAGHALLPVLHGREAAVAGCLGLVHGVGGASRLGGFGLGTGSIVGFRLGVEAAVLAVVAAAWLAFVLLSRTEGYRWVRVVGAWVAGGLATGWMLQRLGEVANPAEGVMTALAERSGWIVAGLVLVGVVVWRVAGGVAFVNRARWLAIGQRY